MTRMSLGKLVFICFASTVVAKQMLRDLASVDGPKSCDNASKDVTLCMFFFFKRKTEVFENALQWLGRKLRREVMLLWRYNFTWEYTRHDRVSGS